MSTDNAVYSRSEGQKYSDGIILLLRILVTMAAVILTIALAAPQLEYLLIASGLNLSMGHVLTAAVFGAVVWPAARWFSGSYDFD